MRLEKRGVSTGSSTADSDDHMGNEGGRPVDREAMGSKRMRRPVVIRI